MELIEFFNPFTAVGAHRALRFLLVLCNVRIRSHPLNEQQDQITLFDGGKL